MVDLYKGQQTRMGDPSPGLKKVTPNDATDLPDGTCRALLVGGGGSANIIDANGNDLVLVPLQIGYNPIRVSRVKTGGTATDIWALY